MGDWRKAGEKRRILAAALGFVATTGVFGAFGTFATFENRALFGEETAANRPIVAVPRDAEPNDGEVVAPPQDGALESPTGFKAFLVGADDYRDANDLAFVKNDVEALAARLIELGFEEKNVAVLKTGGDFSDFPTKDNIEERFATFVENLRPGDFAVVYLSGHGIQSTDSNEAFFAPIDVKTRDPFGTAVSIDKMLAALEASDANFRWMIVDACRDDPTNAKTIFKTKSAGAKGLVSIDLAPKSTSLLQSCQPGKFSYEGGDGVENGVFTLSLLEALDRNNPRADVDRDGALAFSEVFKYVTERTNELALQHHGATQRPNWSGQITDFAILKGLLRDGLTQARWLDADALYQEACVLRRKREYRKAAAKLAEARKINAVNEAYKAEEELLAELLANQTALQEAQEAAQEAANAEAAARERWAREEAEAEARVDEAILAKARKLREESISAAQRKDWGMAASKMEASLTLIESKSSRELLKKYQAERDRLARERAAALAPRWNGERYVSANESEANRQTSNADQTSTPGTSSPTKAQTATEASASGDWFGPYAAGTVKSLKINGIEYRFHYCPAGTFQMGSPTSGGIRSDEGPQHRVELPNGFWMLETEVTQAMWKSVMGSNPSKFTSSERNPVEQVSWNDCQDFIAKLNSSGIAPEGFQFRLPTEAEWEYACRAGTTTAYFWGSSLNGDKANCNGNETSNPYGIKGKYLERPTQVGSYAPNPWGLYDMHGNVWEWCVDWYDRDFYKKLKNVQNPINVAYGSGRVVRGGGWNYAAWYCRSTERGRYSPTFKGPGHGFRLALGRKLED